MNPFDNVGTLRVSTSVHDRLCRLAVDYQDEQAERSIVMLRTGVSEDDAVARCLVGHAVAATRATRSHEHVRQGSSVRGAIDTVLVARELAALRGVTEPRDEAYGLTLLHAMTVALSGRIQLDEVAETTPEAVLREIWADVLVLDLAHADPG